MALAVGQRGVGLAVQRRAIRRGAGHRGDAHRERPRLRASAVPGRRPIVDPALEGRGQDAAQGEVGAVGVDARHQHGELVAPDPEDLVVPAQAGG